MVQAAYGAPRDALKAHSRHVVADANRRQFDIRVLFDPTTDGAQMLLQIIAGVGATGASAYGDWDAVG